MPSNRKSNPPSLKLRRAGIENREWLETTVVCHGWLVQPCVVRRTSGLKPRASRLSGFTLTEMMVAIALAMIIMLVVTTAFSQGSALFNTSNAKIEALHNGKVVMDTIARDLGQLDTNRTGTPPFFIGCCIADVGSKHFGVNNNSNVNGDIDDPDLQDPAHDDDPEFYDSAHTGLNGESFRETNGMEFLTKTGEHVLYYVTNHRRSDDTKDWRLVRLFWSPAEDDDGDNVIDDPLPHIEAFPANGNPMTGADPLGVNSWTKRGAVGVDVVVGALRQYGVEAERSYTLAYGVRQFKLRYFYRDPTNNNYSNSVWFDGWDSTDGFGWNGVDDFPAVPGTPDGPDLSGDDVQHNNVPAAIEVTIELVDEEGLLAKGNHNPLVIKRVCKVQ